MRSPLELFQVAGLRLADREPEAGTGNLEASCWGAIGPVLADREPWTGTGLQETPPPPPAPQAGMQQAKASWRVGNLKLGLASRKPPHWVIGRSRRLTLILFNVFYLVVYK